MVRSTCSNSPVFYTRRVYMYELCSFLYISPYRKPLKKGHRESPVALLSYLAFIKRQLNRTYLMDQTNRMNNAHVLYNERYQCRSLRPLMLLMEYVQSVSYR